MAKSAAGVNEWEAVQDEPRIKIKLDTEGDEFIGLYEGMQHIVDPNLNKDGEHDEWNTYNFIGVSPDEIADERVTIYESAHLRQAMEQIESGGKWLVRIIRGKDIPVRNQPSPMATFKVDRRLA